MPNSVASLLIAVDSPPGTTSASTVSSSSGRRTGRAMTSSSARACRCSRVSPCRASTPMIMPRSPAALCETVRLRDLFDVDADHGLAQAAGDLRDDVGVVVERDRLDDRGGAL